MRQERKKLAMSSKRSYRELPKQRKKRIKTKASRIADESSRNTKGKTNRKRIAEKEVFIEMQVYADSSPCICISHSTCG